jgi:hypothetical protein
MRWNNMMADRASQFAFVVLETLMETIFYARVADGAGMILVLCR